MIGAEGRSLAFRAAPTLTSVLLAAMALHGCAVLAVPAVGSAAASGGGELVRAGAGSIQNGTVYRTFDAPLREVHAAVRTTLSRLGFPGPEEQVHEERVTLRTNAIVRRVRIELQSITSALTQVSVTVASGPWRKDPATATTLVDLVAETLGPPKPRALSRPTPRRSERPAKVAVLGRHFERPRTSF